MLAESRKKLQDSARCHQWLLGLGESPENVKITVHSAKRPISGYQKKVHYFVEGKNQRKDVLTCSLRLHRVLELVADTWLKLMTYLGKFNSGTSQPIL
jgi:hypothetical protein